ncbi:PaaI family thioesterase [Caenispirillum bisanense]|uniref:PaaI family thioesterase n=1 Tax=Caenispirillum bisanense TaxID=414052 RepID=UPI0031D1B0CF
MSSTVAAGPAPATASATVPPDPAWRERIHAIFAAQGAMRAIDARLVLVEPGLCEIALPFAEHVSQQNGFFHGGVVGTVGDSAGGFAGYSLMPAGSNVLTTEYKMNLVSPARGDWLIARGEVLKPGRTLTVTRVDVFVAAAPSEAARKLCATLLQTLIRVDPPAAG